MNITEAYNRGVQAAWEKIAFNGDVGSAALGFVSPTLSGLAADDGKGLQTSAAALAGNILGKKLFKSNGLGRLMGAGGAYLGSNVGAGLVSPDPQVIEEMKRRGEFSKWDAVRKGARGAAFGAGIGATFAGVPAAYGALFPAAGSGAAAASIPAAALAGAKAAIPAGLGNIPAGTFRGAVTGPMVNETMKTIGKLSDPVQKIPEEASEIANHATAESQDEWNHLADLDDIAD